jgi:putative ATPase
MWVWLRAAVYLATAPKSNALYEAYGKAKQEAGEKGNLPVPMELRNAPNALMRQLGYGREYRYPHDYREAYVPMSYLPEALEKVRFYQPSNRGYEATLEERLESWRRQVEDAKRKARSAEGKVKG